VGFRLLAVLPLAWAAAFLAGDVALHGTPAYAPFLRTEIELAKVLTLVGSWAAAAAFARGDYQRRAWVLVGLCMAFLLLRDLTLAPAVAGTLREPDLSATRGVLVVVANVSQVVGTWMLARTWKVAELALPGSRRGQLAVRAGTIALSLAVAGPAVVRDGSRVLDGQLAALPGVASALGDVISLCLIAPLLLTAVALRGGLFAWTWTLLSVSYLAWLLYDAFALLAAPAGFGAHVARTGGELFRALGCLYGFSAGLAQRRTVQQLRGRGGRSRAPLAGAA
jgi:hypothetical protein